MAESIVTLRVDTRNAVSSLNNASAATHKLSAASKGATTALTSTTAAANGLGTALKSTLAPLLAIGSAFTIVNGSLNTFLSRERDIKILEQGLKNLGRGSVALNDLQEVADKFGKTTLFNQEDFTRGFNLLTSFRNIGVDSYERVAQSAADIAQVNQVDVSTSFMQLAKALQDPERNLSNLNRSGIAFTKQQQKVIKELMKTNRIAEAHTMILDIVDESYNELSQAAAVGFAGSVDTLGEEFRDFGETIGKSLIPVLDPAAKGITAILNFLNSEGGQATAIIGGLILAVKGLNVVLPLLNINFLRIKVAAQIATGQLIGTQAALQATKVGFVSAAVAANAFKVALAKTGIGLAVLALGALITKLLEANAAQKDFNELLQEGSSEAISKEIEVTQKEVDKLKKGLESLKGKAGTQAKANRLRITRDLEEANEKLEKLQRRLPMIQGVELSREFEKTKKELEEQNQELKDIEERLKIGTEEGRTQFDLEKRKNELIEKYGEELAQQILDQEEENRKLEKSVDILKKKDEAAKKLKDRFMEIGQSVEDGIVDNLADAVEGTKTLGEAAISVLNDLKRKLIEVAIQQAVSGIGGKVGKFLQKVFNVDGNAANGGRIGAGQSFLVGERGPEIFTPRSAGMITANDNISLGGRSGVTNVITVNVDANSTNVSGNDAEANQLGNQIAIAIQSELIKQKRAGGLLA